jgi:hypothetical protein
LSISATISTGASAKLRNRPVNYVSITEVNFCRSARAFDYNHFKMLRQPSIAADYRRPRLFSIVIVFRGGHVKAGFAVDDHLAAPLAFRLEQDRIHINRRTQPACFGLNGLRSPDLSTGGAYSRIVGHVLRFERGDANPGFGEQPAQRRNDDALTYIRGSPHHHQATRTHEKSHP